jgi:hypothetical protein
VRGAEPLAVGLHRLGEGERARILLGDSLVEHDEARLTAARRSGGTASRSSASAARSARAT